MSRAGTSAGTFLVVKPNILSGGRSYTFFVTVVDQYGSASANTTVAINAPPSNGSFSVSPESGNALQTIFSLAAASWSDSDLPITFAYFTVFSAVEGASASDGLVLVRTDTITTLPAGEETQNNTVSLALEATDSLGAVTFADGVFATVVYAGDDASGFVANVTDEIEELIALGDTEEAVTAITWCAALLNSYADDAKAAAGLRSDLLGLLTNASSRVLKSGNVTSNQVKLPSRQSAAVFQIRRPWQLTEAFLSLSGRAAGSCFVANRRRAG